MQNRGEISSSSFVGIGNLFLSILDTEDTGEDESDE